ncbi:hypothetical protein MNBD_BACTEROID04-719, partial [hydrothermal vent metagenome]
MKKLTVIVSFLILFISCKKEVPVVFNSYDETS